VRGFSNAESLPKKSEMRDFARIVTHFIPDHKGINVVTQCDPTMSFYIRRKMCYDNHLHSGLYTCADY
jgi:hypothetical protein